MNALRHWQRQPRVVQALGLLGLFFVIAWLDLLDQDLSLFALYLIPALYAAWFLGLRWAYVSCLASAVVWAIADLGGPAFYHRALILYWNVAGRLIVLTVIVAVVNALKRSLEVEHEYEAERRGTQRELEIAREVQKRLLPSQAPECPRMDFDFFHQSARDVGGDYYDFIPFSPEQMGVVVGDVCGKGLPSSLLMASLQGMVRTNLDARQGEVARFAIELNDSFHALTASDRYATLFFAVVDVPNQTLHYVNAGHNPPLLFRIGTSPASDQSMIESLECGGPPIGILARSQYQSEHVRLHAGDVLVAYTDGVVEALNLREEEFGEERLSDIVRSSLSLGAVNICKRIAEQLQAFVAESPQRDDITLVVMKVKPE
ncbi:putative Phosphoserine phosphatase [Acidobacteriia bacterium SbA2]|nr:putative Phosphoserine phosphatase [Acidobacteriia bacterium SbA2]